jgi:glyceraldehyde-3-phosphate dehydrogenase (NADP+)
VPCSNELAERMAVDPRVAVVSFTGSARVGWQLKTKVPRARVILELGGNAAAIVAEDADFDWAVERIARGGYIYSGQVCISVQRIFVARALYPRFMEALRRKVAGYQVADPREAGTMVGPLIDEGAARRIEAWLGEAAAAGASVEGGARSGNRLQPAIVERAPRDAKVVREEIFGPVVVAEPYDDFEQALTAVNEGDYGLQAGIFTQDLRRIRHAWEVLEVGGVIANDAPTFRADNMPYGGVKGSGLGREGVRLAAEEMCEPRMLVMAR